jgi:lipopolysaccharide/colanic/teichoic acid biosynthesis glycosyltransferase
MFLDHAAAQNDSTIERNSGVWFDAELLGTADRNWYWVLKRWMDVLLALSLLVLGLPFIYLAAVLVKLTSRGPAFYSQVRLGLGGAPFHIYKLRTMYHNCERWSGPCRSKPQDMRVTPVGRFLRKAHIDELPQLWNVILGDMSLVGPRPERPELIPPLESKIPGYRCRLQVRPGVTGLAQIQLPPDTDLDSVRRKLVYDLYYVRQLGLGLDLGILLATPCYLVRIPFALTSRVLHIPSAREVEATYPCASPVLEAVRPQHCATSAQ